MKDNRPIILIVDDSAENLQILSASLNRLYQLKVAKGGVDCIKLVKEEPHPDLILLDISMPDMDGYEVCRTLKKNPKYKSIPIIFVTAKEDIEDEEKGFSVGAVDYITKPIRPSIVQARVKTHILIKKQRDELERMALRDQLTDLYNRHYLMEVGVYKASKSRRHGYPLTALMIDIDYFKTINDNYGHHVGDAVLKAVAEIIGGHNRAEDIAARMGGEEFLVVLDHCDLKNGVKKAEYLREQIEGLKPSGVEVTISIGVAEIRANKDSFFELVKRADTAVYQAKANGRNQVVSV